MLRLLASLLILAGLAVPAAGQGDGAPSAGERPAIAFRPAVVDAIERVILPGYATLAEAAAAEATRASDLCWQADAPRLAAAQAGFRDLVLAWSAVEMFRFGPVRDDNRYERLFFWPDPRGRALQQIQGLLAAEDPTAVAVDTLRLKSVAVQGLPALEYVLFGTGSEALASPGPDTYRCRYGAAIAAAIAATAREIAEGWIGDQGYAALMRDAGPANPVYRSHGEVVQELVKACREQVQLDRQLKLALTVGPSAADARPRLAPFWRSGLTVPSIRANLAAVASLCGADGVGAVLPSDAQWQALSLEFELRSADTPLAALEQDGMPWEALVADPDSRDRLSGADIPLGGAVDLLERGYPDALGLITGFNALDGD